MLWWNIVVVSIVTTLTYQNLQKGREVTFVVIVVIT